ncbi:formate/nitrite transporter family protein [Rhodopseudomonas palustris]|uniref:formate/nitrite transporter family protein n=1 Tax=Rhodopseudomonas palustris TaxID=1076 RepID=UPI0020CCD439|nr:formate/nitrite transporter family protein [Rhodopseudomonas palustris]MCP9627973.1 formate/nitrite transporter family protein [Rhodopseudomonas palustris]
MTGDGDLPGERGDPPRDAGSSASRARISSREVEDVEARSSPRTPVIYEIVRRTGEEEMVRPLTSLWWSGLAAGLSISFSLLVQAILQQHIPDAPWRPLITSLGYSVGFVMVVLARQQLFTENTVTVILPVMAEPTARNFGRAARLWAIVLCANLAGTLFAAAFCSLTPTLPPEMRAEMIEISRAILGHGALDTAFKGVAAGFLMATMVWLLPSAEGGQLGVIVTMTWLISVGGFAHIVAGSMEAFMLVLNGAASPFEVTTGFLLPALIGNIIGGTALFALLAYAQVMKEID